MTSPDAPIGVFDSGVGGLTVTRTIADQLPGEPQHQVSATGDPMSFARLARRFLGPSLAAPIAQRRVRCS